MNSDKDTWVSKLKKRWGIQHNWEILIILVVFACTGFTAMYFKRWIFDKFGINTLAIYWRVLLWIVIVLPAYQILLLTYGFLFGKFDFFLKFVKKMFGLR